MRKEKEIQDYIKELFSFKVFNESIMCVIDVVFDIIAAVTFIIINK